MGVINFLDLKRHVGHKFDCVTYGQNDNVSLECLTCSEVIIDFESDEENT